MIVTGRQRDYWVDLLRIFASVAVIGLHICSGGLWYSTAVSSSSWLAINFYGSLTKWCVPIFVMISGMIFLNPKKEITVKSIYTRYVPRLVAAYITWSTIYVLYTNWGRLSNFNFAMLKEFVGQVVKGHYHTWYIYMIAGIYLITPPLRKMVENCSRKMLEYFLLLWLVFAIVIPTITLFPNTGLIGLIAKSLGMTFVMSFVGYYVLGYYLSTIPITKTLKRVLYMCGIVGAILTVGISTYMSLSSGKPNRAVHGNYSINVFLMVIGIFTFYREFISAIKLGEWSKKIISQISSCCFGIYLCHPLFLYLLNKIGLNIGAFHPIFSVPILVCTTFLISYIFIWLTGKLKIKLISIVFRSKA